MAGLEPQITGAGVVGATAAFSYASQTNTEVELVGTMSGLGLPATATQADGLGSTKISRVLKIGRASVYRASAQIADA